MYGYIVDGAHVRDRASSYGVQWIIHDSVGCRAGSNGAWACEGTQQAQLQRIVANTSSSKLADEWYIVRLFPKMLTSVTNYTSQSGHEATATARVCQPEVNNRRASMLEKPVRRQ